MIWVGLWLLLMGVWPFADPGHAANSPASVLDLALHAVGALILVLQWRVWRGDWEEMP